MGGASDASRRETKMIDLGAWFLALGAVAAAALVTWVVSVFRRDVSIVDSLWSLMFLLAVLIYVGASENIGPRAWLIVAMVAVWALRLSGYITMRNHGEPEDRRYQAIRRNNQPHFWLKSLFIVFFLQGFLAWVIVLPALAAVSGQTSPGPLDWIGAAVWATGLTFEAVGDWQLRRSAAVVGRIPGGRLCGGVVDDFRPAADDFPVAARIRRRPAGKGHQRPAARIPGLHPAHQRIHPMAAQSLSPDWRVPT